MNYIRTEENGQMAFDESRDFLKIPSTLYGFTNTSTELKTAVSGRKVYDMQGTVAVSDEDRKCPVCGGKMHVNNHPLITLKHLNFGETLSQVSFEHYQLRCTKCGKTKSQYISFKAPWHMITDALYNYTRDLLALGTFTNKEVAYITGLGKNTVKAIDKKRLQEEYTIDGKALKKPDKKATYLGIDEFKLHNGRRYATIIIDLETGHVLWIQKGKKKQVVYDFIDHVGMQWLKNVKAVACDMNSDFQEAFYEKCPWLQVVYDHFHIVKNFNDRVVGEVRKDEQRRLIEEGDIEAAKAFKKSKYILISSRKTLQRKDADAASGRIIHKGSELFKTDDITRRSGYEAKYDELLDQNKLLFTLDVIKDKLDAAYRMTDEDEMAEAIADIMDTCDVTGNEHLRWFRNLLGRHFSGIIAHAVYHISSGKVEGTNQRIKTLRRKGYGYPDDDYFFLKIIDSSRNEYIRNQKSHKICD